MEEIKCYVIKHKQKKEGRENRKKVNGMKIKRILISTMF